MDLGVVFPQLEIGSDPAVIRRYARTVEELGFDHLLAYDHVLGANPDREGGWEGPYDVYDSFHEPLTLFGYLAGVTGTLELVTGILILPQRQTVLAAKQAAQVDLLNDGRFRMGVAVGWNPIEYRALGQDFETRGERLDDQIRLMRRLWTEEVVDEEDRWHRVPDAGLTLLPRQRPIPVWIGGMSEAAKRRAARLGDGWLPRTPAEETEKHLEELDRYLEEEGRSREAVGLNGRLGLFEFEEPEWADQLARWRALGATHVSVDTMYMGLDRPADHLDALERFMNQVS